MIHNYVQLHAHSDYSPQDGACTVESLVKRAAELAMPAVALTDHGRCGGLLQLKKATKKAGIKPIYGCELYVAPGSRLVRDKVEGHNTSYHLTVLAKNDEGLRNIFCLSSIGWLDGFYYKPRVDLETLKKYKDGLIVLSGCSSGQVANRFLEDKHQESKDYAMLLRKIWKDDFYIEVQNHGMDWQQPLRRWLFNLSDVLGIPIVATQDSHFIYHEDAVLHQKICKLAAGDLEFGTTENYFKSYEEMCRCFDENEQKALLETLDVAEKCNVNWDYGRTIWPVYPIQLCGTPEREVRVKAENGFERLFGPRPSDTYRSRLAMELDVIEKMGFSTYFLVVADFIDWARRAGIPVGPGRGSGAGSLVCYCLGITEVDPIKYGLYFERFLNPARVSLPDLDIDFCPRGRKDVMAYVGSKYGDDRVAQIGTYAQFKPRGALRDFARVCGYEPAVGARLAELIPPDKHGKPLTFDEAIEAEPKLLTTQWPEVVDLARKAEGIRTKAGVHAAGVVISNDDLKTQVPLFRGRGDEVATQFDMHDVEEIGLVKYDFLGLINLTIIQDAVKLIKEHRGIDIDISAIPENDMGVFENVFQTGRLDGIFQFETSSGFRDLCIRVKPRSIEDLSAITALFRPGPLGTGLVDKYVIGRNGGRVDYLVPELEPILRDTYGVMVYQEQVMRICTDLAGYTAAEADVMRKAIGKKIAAVMKSQREEFVDGCVKNGIPQKAATQLFNDIEGFADYSFNKAHSVAYSVISYRTAWLKNYYPEEFYCALLNNTIKEQDQLVRYIYSCKENGIAIEPPDINRSGALFTIDSGTILFGLGGIKGMGEKTCAKLLENRGEGFGDLQGLIAAGASSKDIKCLAQCGALEGITELGRGAIVDNVDELIKYQNKIEKWRERRDRYEQREGEIKTAIAGGHKPPKRLPKLPEPPEEPKIQNSAPLSREERIRLEHETLGFYLTGHPLDSYPDLYKIATHNLEKVLDSSANGEFVRFPAVISALIRKRTRKGKDMATLLVEDKSARAEVTIFPSTWNKLKEDIEENMVAVLTCKTDREAGEEASIVRLVLNEIHAVTDSRLFQVQKIEDLYMSLPEGAKVRFVVTDRTPRDGWQRAAAILNNLENTK